MPPSPPANDASVVNEIIGIGIDLVDTTRFEDETAREETLKSWLSAGEYSSLQDARNNAKSVATIVALKEAVAKALGTGFNSTVSWQDIAMETLEPPYSIRLSGGAKDAASASGISRFLTTTDALPPLIVAIAIALGKATTGIRDT